MSTLADVPDLMRTHAACVIIDCRYVLGAPDAGRANYLEAHIAGAVYADLARDLSGPPTTDRGRHPLPPVARLCSVFGALGIDNATAVVAYDDQGGMVAARVWWMLRYLGHSAVRVLDGGWQAWVAAGGTVASGWDTNPARHFVASVRSDRLATLAEVETAEVLVDARAPARYRGESEPLDPYPGHIPGARNHYWQDNLAADGRFLDPRALERQLVTSLAILPDAATVHYCGSGVSACHNVLAQVHAGLPEPRLYCGSWSEWCLDNRRPRALGGDCAR
jgi:thiosulfate/3-mercaptopyruvate sulfurtransferase